MWWSINLKHDIQGPGQSAGRCVDDGRGLQCLLAHYSVGSISNSPGVGDSIFEYL